MARQAGGRTAGGHQRALDPALTDLLRLTARVPLDAPNRLALAEAAARVESWADLPDAAEAHGLAPLTHVHLSRADLPIPLEVRQRLFGLAALHRQANRVRCRALAEILDAFEAAGISVLVLKGAALAHLLYPSRGLRPLSDLDLLVAAREAGRAQRTLASLGFAAPEGPASRRLAGHHHLPAATKHRDGHFVHVEIHRDALSRDVAGSLSMERTYEARQSFSIDGRPAHTFGHADMLYHLCRHLAERAALLRLIWVADVVAYAARFRDVIVWDDLRERYPFVLNTLSLLHLLTPLPEELLAHVAPARAAGMRGIGVAGRPLSESIRRGRPLRAICRDVLMPSEWWLRLHYGVSGSQPLGWHRWVVHPLHVGRSLARRAGAYARWWVRGAYRSKSASRRPARAR